MKRRGTTVKRLPLLIGALLVLSAAVFAFAGCGGDDATGEDTTTDSMASTVDASATTTAAGPSADTSSTAYIPTGDEATAQAEAALVAFFQAWQAEDEEAVESLLTERRQRAIDWQFEDLERVEFGAATTADDEIEAYLTFGGGSEEDLARDDVRCFRASVTFYYEPDAAAATQSGDELDWVWFLVRDADGEWRIDDWGY